MQMADLSKLKRRQSSIGLPPPIEEASRNLSAPETAPVEVMEPVLVAATSVKSVRSPSKARIDGRTRRRSGRHLQFATRVSWEWDEKLRQIAERDGLMLVEVLERSLEAYEARRSASR
jgi:hypothetical protein